MLRNISCTFDYRLDLVVYLLLLKISNGHSGNFCEADVMNFSMKLSAKRRFDVRSKRNKQPSSGVPTKVFQH